MAVNFAVQAQVVDIQADTPKATDVFLVDTNVWFWISYANAGGAPYQTRNYPPFVSSAIRIGAKLLRCELSLAELAHRIEQTELEIYQQSGGVSLKPKEFRHNYPAERTRIVAEVRTAWATVKTMAQPLSVTVDEPTADMALANLQGQQVDGYDLFILEAAKQGQIDKVLTDDGDYCTVPGIQVFTANRNVIAAAKAQGKLLVR